MAHRRSYNSGAAKEDGAHDIRDPLGKAFLRKLTADFTTEGKKPLERLRRRRPFDYLKLVVAFLPKKFQGRDPLFADMSDEEFFEVFTAIRAAVAEHKKAQERGGGQEGAGGGGG